jgi:hypothetical protein
MLLTFSLWAVSWLPAQATLDDYPYHTFLWNDFSSIRVIDSFAVATSEFGLIVLQFDQITQRFDAVNQLLMNTRPFTAKRFGQVLAVQSEADIIHFVDLSQLPNLSILGEIDIGLPFYDFAIRGNDLYVAAGFGGLRCYELTDYSAPQFRDSSLTGVHCIQIDIEGDQLMVLDDYNGVARYDLSGGGLGVLIDFLYIPLQAGSFLWADTILIIGLENHSQLFFAAYTPDGPAITDTVDLVGYSETLFAIDTLVLSLDPVRRVMEVINLNDLSKFLVTIYSIRMSELDGDVFAIGGVNYLVLSGTELGLSSFLVDDLWFDRTPHQAYTRPGPVTELLMHNGRLITAGQRNPLEIYSIDAEGLPVLDTALYGLDNIGAMAAGGEGLFVYYPDAGYIFVMRLRDDSVTIVNTVPGIGSDTRELKWYEGTTDSLSLLLAVRNEDIDIFSVTQALDVNYETTVHSLSEIREVIVEGGILVVSTGNRDLSSYQIWSDFWIESLGTTVLPEDFTEMVSTGRGTYGFTASDMYRLEVAGPVIWHVTGLPFDVIATSTFPTNNRLYTAGELGIGVFDLTDSSPPLPVLIDQGGFGGHLIAAYGERVAISNGNGIHLYAVDTSRVMTFVDDAMQKPPDDYLLQNHPNPFNPSTRIEYSLAASSMVELSVVNILGQRIVTLFEGLRPAGHHSVVWDGTDASGHLVASGIYFYRLVTPNVVESRKMILLK